MTDQLKNLVSQYSEYFDKWTDSINEHNELMYSEDRTNYRERLDTITESAANTLASIFGVVKKFGNFKDS